MQTDHSFRLPVLFNQTKWYHISEDNIIAANRRASNGGTAREELRKVTSVVSKMAADRRGGQHDKSVPNFISCYRERHKHMRPSKGPKSSSRPLGPGTL